MNAYGKRINQIDFQEGEQGKTIKLTIDTEIQKYTEELLNEKAGSISIMDIYTGEIIAMNSSPSFDPNLFLYGIEKNKWKEIQKNPLKPFKQNCFRSIFSRFNNKTYRCTFCSRKSCNFTELHS